MPDLATLPQPPEGTVEPALPALAWIHALQPGTWPASPADLTVTADDIAGMAAAYDAERYRAPIVIGHPETDSPAWGWVLSAEARADGLWLGVELAPELADLVRERRYGAVSLALWPPGAAGNPSPGVWAIKHLGFLGAAPPAVKGLQRVQLAEGTAICCERTCVVALAEAPNQSTTASQPTTTHQSTTAPNREDRTMPESSPDAAQREQQLAERERRLAEREQELRRAQFAAELEPHIAGTRILAAERDEIVQIMERLAEAGPVTLAEGAPRGALDVFRGFLARLAPRVELRTLAAADRRGAAGPAVSAVRIPSGMRVSESGSALHERAAVYMAEHPGTDYVTAVRAVERA